MGYFQDTPGNTIKQHSEAKVGFEVTAALSFHFVIEVKSDVRDLIKEEEIKCEIAPFPDRTF